MDGHPPDIVAKAPTGKYPLAAATLSVVLFVLLCVTGLEGQGLYYDEVHQAPASFLWLGKEPYTFTPLAWGKIPLLTMPYSGAVKSNIYGAWMKLSGMEFTVTSWRLSGIFLVGIGLFLFCLFAARALRPLGLAVFLVFFLSDVSVLLMSRHDWGPVAVALMLRLIWLGIWIRAEAEETTGTALWVLLGFLPAFSVYEKLNNVVLIGPLALAVLLSGKRLFVKRFVAVSLGFLAGLVPLAVVNLATGGISYRAYLGSSSGSVSGGFPYPEVIPFLKGFLSLGAGHEVRQFILGVPSVAWGDALEISLLVLSLGVAGVLAAGSWREDPHARLAGIGLLAYLSILLLTLSLLLKESGGHHWITGTPFQYVAMAMAADFFLRKAFPPSRSVERPPSKARSFPVVLAAGMLIIFGILRGYNVMVTESDLAARRASPAWDPSYTAVARFAVQHGRDASFIAADWGFAPQIYSLSNGAFPVAEPIWNWGYEWNPDALRWYLARKPGRPVYLLLRKLDPPLNPAATKDIVNVVSYLSGGKQLPLEEELKNLKSVMVLKFASPVR